MWAGCMVSDTGADFPRVCAGKRIGYLLFATHPFAVCARFYVSTVYGDSHRSESLFTAQYLVLGVSHRVEQ